MGKITQKIQKYFFKQLSYYIIEIMLNYHIRRIKKKHFDKIRGFMFIKDRVEKEGASAFITLEKKPVIGIQFETIFKSLNSYMLSFLEDNIIDILRHEFAHLKERGEGEKHLKWSKEIDLFKKNVKK